MTPTRPRARELARPREASLGRRRVRVIRTYLEWIISLPWNQLTEDKLDLAAARKILDEDHYDLEKVKDRIIEYPRGLEAEEGSLRRPILCFVGPPGVGKTSLGKSIARTSGASSRASPSAAVRDEAEIRGHRRTYIGAMPGTIIRSLLRDAESKNPVMLIDEIDKMGADFRGDPASAMLEVLDPEQNSSFRRDHYLDLPFDLSKVLFICTANTLDTIPGPLLDRMDVIPAVGLHRGREARHREEVPPLPEAAQGARADEVAARRVGHDAAARHPRVHARGGRAQPGAPARRPRPQGGDVDREGRGGEAEGRREALREWLGPRRFSGEVRKRTADPGVATGLAYTAVGGDVLFIEATAYAGKGKLTITGQLGEVMQESAQAALSWVRAHTDKLGLPEDWFSKHDVHIHVPPARCRRTARPRA